MTSRSDISCELSAGDLLKLIKKAQNVSSAIGLFCVPGNSTFPLSSADCFL